jgi:hypothetical protein
MQPLADTDRRYFWRGRRLRFNIALLTSGFFAGLAFVAALVAWNFWPPPAEEVGHADFEMLSLVLAPVAYGVAMGIANLCYLLGPASEVLLRPRNVDAVRRRAYALGVSFSVALPWFVPLNAWCEFVTVQMHR